MTAFLFNHCLLLGIGGDGTVIHTRDVVVVAHIEVLEGNVLVKVHTVAQFIIGKVEVFKSCKVLKARLCRVGDAIITAV